MSGAGEFKIEKGIPLPAHGNYKGRIRYPLAEMEVGDSFFIPADDPAKRQSSMSATLAINGARWGKRFSCRRVEGGVRIWRVE